MTDNTAVGGEPYVGKKLSSHSFLVEEETLDSYYDGLDLPRPAQQEAIPSAPSMLASGPDGDYFSEIAFSNPYATLKSEAR